MHQVVIGTHTPDAQSRIVNIVKFISCFITWFTRHLRHIPLHHAEIFFRPIIGAYPG